MRSSPLFVPQFRAIPLPHGPDSSCLGFQFGPVAYLSDVSSVPERVLEFLVSLPVLRVLIIDALRIKDTNSAHLNLPQALAVVQQVRRQVCFFVLFAKKRGKNACVDNILRCLVV